MKKIRVLVANQPRLMRELMLATISEQPDIEILGEVNEDGEILNAVDEKHPDVLIIGLDRPDERPSMCDFLLERHPQLRILAVSPESNSTVFYWASLAIHSDDFEASEQGVLHALRTKVG